MSRIPSPTQSPKGGNGGARSFGLRLRLLVAHLQQVAVGIQNLDQADDATFVGGKRVLARARERRFTPRQDADLGLAFDEGREGVLRFLGRSQHGQPICRECFGLLTTRGGDFGLAPFDAVVEATVQRSRPVILTALAAMLAFIPLTQSVFWGTLAYTLIGGTFGGTVLTLVFLPALYAIWFKIRPVAKGEHAATEVRTEPVPA
jgi:hypothetical protein